MIAERHADLVVVGAGTGGCAAALAALRTGLIVIMTEETSWIGGQLTSQAVPPDENAWIEHFPPTATYGDLRARVRDYYRRNFPLSDLARGQRYLNPGNAEVGPLCADPRVFLAVLHELFAPYLFVGRLTILHSHVVESAEVHHDIVESVRVRNTSSGDLTALCGRYFLDATDTGELLPLAGAEHVIGAESQADTGEPHAVNGEARPDVMPAFNWAFVCDHVEGADHTIERPVMYEHFSHNVPTGWISPQLSWQTVHWDTEWVDYDYSAGPVAAVPKPGRRILDSQNLVKGFTTTDVCCVNALQTAYLGGASFGDGSDDHRELARQLSLSFVYWLQTEAPRADGGAGFPGLRLRPDAVGSSDGLAQAPYIRESRRIIGLDRVREQDVAGDENRDRYHADSVGIAHYFLDMWPRTDGFPPFLVPTQPAQIPLGVLIPVRLRNLLPAAKNASLTHITNSMFRMHAGEWAVGEASGALAAHCIRSGAIPASLHGDPNAFDRFHAVLSKLGVQTTWPRFTPHATWSHLAEAWRLGGGTRVGLFDDSDGGTNATRE